MTWKSNCKFPRNRRQSVFDDLVLKKRAAGIDSINKIERPPQAMKEWVKNIVIWWPWKHRANMFTEPNVKSRELLCLHEWDFMIALRLQAKPLPIPLLPLQSSPTDQQFFSILFWMKMALRMIHQHKIQFNINKTQRSISSKCNRN